ncbi:hypothetical protein QJS10_CPA05g00801 [Acorus calamus]|uniref:Homeobox domain-containing protein n=1 Tax=Acorus calamus TaxID=4465 RepID=A0AAV9EXZ7_ACOCL|nr:hypothetical protein QJS10_CPA05g00801 [Acorus calamus]
MLFKLWIGLSEKQISGWFCHRRLKDKKLVKDEGCVNDNKSSGSSSASLERVIEYEGYDYIRPSRYLCIDGNYLRNSEGKMRGHTMGSGYGYSSMQENIENPVISAVKRRLGRNYVEDGPPLAVEFQSLPPGAFDSPLKDPVHEPHYMGDPTKHYSVGISKVQREQNVARKEQIMVYGIGGGKKEPRRCHNEKLLQQWVCKTHSTEMHAYGSNLKGADFSRTFKGKHNRDEFISFSTRTSLFGNYTKYAPGRNSVKAKKENPIQTHPYKGVTAKVFLGIEQSGDKQFRLNRQHSNSINDEVSLQHRVLLKEEKLCKQRIRNGFCSSAKLKLLRRNEAKSGGFYCLGVLGADQPLSVKMKQKALVHQYIYKELISREQQIYGDGMNIILKADVCDN